jgi:hypothetical protein
VEVARLIEPNTFETILGEDFTHQCWVTFTIKFESDRGTSWVPRKKTATRETTMHANAKPNEVGPVSSPRPKIWEENNALRQSQSERHLTPLSDAFHILATRCPELHDAIVEVQTQVTRFSMEGRWRMLGEGSRWDAAVVIGCTIILHHFVVIMHACVDSLFNSYVKYLHQISF